MAERTDYRQVSDFWLAQVEHRLDRIEAGMARLERQLWTLTCAAGALVALAAIWAIVTI